MGDRPRMENLDHRGAMRIPPAEEFNASGHWYTSYPSLNHWTEDFGHRQYREAFSNYLDHESWSHGIHLYVHIPFCAKLCHYCICNIMITNDREKIQHFLDHLLMEVSNLRRFYEKEGKTPNIKEIHLGGGTPSHLDRDQFTQLCDSLSTICDLKGLVEFAMEIDPRTVKEGDLQFYASKGVTRISFGVQDFDEKVQKAINREQPFEMVQSIMKERRQFRGVNFDLLYGLPLQTHETIRRTVEQVKKLRPDRITLLKYCHVPEVRRHMKLIKVSELPPQEELPQMFVYMAQSFIDAGYKWVGLDHFALPTDSLAIMPSVRTFNGFKPGPVKDMIGLGPTSTASFGGIYAQNHYDLNRYYEAVKRGEFPIERGYKLTEDDIERRTLIFDLLSHQQASVQDYLARDALDLRGKPELCYVEKNRIYLTEYGRLLSRNVCKVFDRRDTEPEHMRIAQKTITRRPIESPARQSA